MHQVVSSDGDATAPQLGVLGAADVQVSPMSLNDIAIEVMTTGNDRPETAEAV